MPWRLPYAPLHHHLSPFARCGRHFSTTSARRCKRTSSLLRSTLAHANVRVGQREVKLECKVNVPEWDERAGAPSPLLRFECMRLRWPCTPGYTSHRQIAAQRANGGVVHQHGPRSDHGSQQEVAHDTLHSEKGRAGGAKKVKMVMFPAFYAFEGVRAGIHVQTQATSLATTHFRETRV